ncbi:hypothetical protein ACOSQ2_006815 [Xanthoceras sorbifolium]
MILMSLPCPLRRPDPEANSSFPGSDNGGGVQHTDLVKVDEFVKEQGSKKEGLQVGEVSVGTVGCDSAPKATEVEVSVGTVGLSEAASNIDTASKFLVAGNVGCNVIVEEQQVAVNNKGLVVGSSCFCGGGGCRF